MRIDSPISEYDVAIIGAGVVGCALAMDLSRYDLRIALVEARSDIGAGTSKANSAILHTGFDAPPGSLEARLVRRGYARFHELSERLGLPIGVFGALMVAWSEEQTGLLSGVIGKAASNGVHNLRRVEREEIYRLEPRLGAGALAAVAVPGESITCPFTPPIAFAVNAIRNGVDLIRRFRVAGIEGGPGRWLLTGSDRKIASRIVINAAGLWSDEIDRLFGKTAFSIRPRKGEFIVFDKPASRLLQHILLPVPTTRTKGVLLTRTVFGNLLLGPTAVDVEDKNDTSVTAEGIHNLLETGYRILPELRGEDVTSTYAGLRAATEHSDYQIHFYPPEGYVTAGGIRSTGLSGALGISEYVEQTLLKEFGLEACKKNTWNADPAPSITDLHPRVCEDSQRIAANNDYGSIVCHCEWVSKGEILDALAGPLPAVDLEGVKRRTRAMLGRCQGFNCLARIDAMLNVHAQV